MSDLAKKAREAMKAKAKRLGSDRPTQKVDSSTFTPPELLNADVKTGLRPLSRRAYKSGGKVQGECAPMRADRKQRKAGGKAESPASYANAKINRNVKSANEEREGIKHVGGMKTGGRAKKNIGGMLKYLSPIAMLASLGDDDDKEKKAHGGRTKRQAGGNIPTPPRRPPQEEIDRLAELQRSAEIERGLKRAKRDLPEFSGVPASQAEDSARRKSGGRAKKQGGGLAGDPRTGGQAMLDNSAMAAGVPKELLAFAPNMPSQGMKRFLGLKKGGKAVAKGESYDALRAKGGTQVMSSAMKKGGSAKHPDEAMDKALIKRMVKKEARTGKQGGGAMDSLLRIVKDIDPRDTAASHAKNLDTSDLIKLDTMNFDRDWGELPSQHKPMKSKMLKRGGQVFSGKGYPGKVPGVTGGRKAKADGGTLPASTGASSAYQSVASRATPLNTATGSMAAAGGNPAMNSSGTMNAAMGAKRTMQGQGIGDQVARMTARNTRVAAARPHKAARLETMNAALANADPTKKGLEAARKGVQDRFGPAKNVREANVKGERSGRGPGRRGRKGKTAVTPATEAPAETKATTTTEAVADTGPKFKRSPRYGSAAMLPAKKGGRIMKYAGGALGYAEGGSPAGAAMPVPSRGGNPMRGGQGRGQNRGPQGGPGQRAPLPQPPQTGGPGATYQPPGYQTAGGGNSPSFTNKIDALRYAAQNNYVQPQAYGEPQVMPPPGGFVQPQTFPPSFLQQAGGGIPPEVMQQYLAANQKAMQPQMYPMQPQVMPGIQMGTGAMGSYQPDPYTNRPMTFPGALSGSAPQAMFNTGGRVGYKKGGKAKAAKSKTNINIVIAGNPKQPDPMADMQAPMPPMPPQGGPPMPPPMGGAPGMPPMPPAPPQGGPGPFKKGGRVYRSYKDMDAGAGSGLGRLEKTEIASRSGRKAGGKVYRSYKDMDAGAGSGLGRLEKSEIQRRK